MTPTEIISTINKSSIFLDVFPDPKNWMSIYRDYVKQIHPDICKEAGVQDAIVKLNSYKHELENGKKFRDDSGDGIYTVDSIIYKGLNKKFLKISFNNYKKISALKDSQSLFFRRYIPNTGELLKDSSLKFNLSERVVPLSTIVEHFNGAIPQEHVNWIMNRIFALCFWMSEIGYVHCGINPETMFVIPEEHGLICPTFYHLTKINAKIKTVSGKFRGFYPSDLFDKSSNKKATTKIDLELATRTALYLLGDKNGNGAKLRKTHNQELLTFYSNIHTNAKETYEKHRALVKKLFPSKFHVLTI